MTRYFFPGCHVKRYYPEASAELERIVLERGWADEATGCCRVNYKKLTADDVAVCVCMNCMAMLDEDSPARVESVWTLADADDALPLPHYPGKTLAVQDCGRAWDRTDVQDAVRSLLAKMGIRTVEAPDAREKSTFCGAAVMHAVPKTESQLAPKRYVEEGPKRGLFAPHTDEEIAAAMKEHAQALPCKDVACYCFSCDKGLVAGGAKPVNVMELATGKFRERETQQASA